MSDRPLPARQHDTRTVTRHYRRAPGGWWWGAFVTVPLLLAVLAQIPSGAAAMPAGTSATVTVTASATTTVTGPPGAPPSTTTASAADSGRVTAAGSTESPTPSTPATPTPTPSAAGTADPRGGPIRCATFSRDVAGVLASAPITFAPGGAQLTDSSRRTIGTVAAALKRCDRLGAVVTGHTDDTGTPADNKAVSDARAAAVRAALAADGVPEGRVASVGAGQDRPLASNDDDAGRAKNRRVDIVAD